MNREELAERRGVSAATVKAWEQGRRKLGGVTGDAFQELKGELRIAGADPRLLRMLDSALIADRMLAGLDTADPERHPLAVMVPDRAVTELLAWPINGQVPRQLAGTPADLDIRPGEARAITGSLRAMAERAAGPGERASMVRRQAGYLLATAGDVDAVRWAAESRARDLRSADLGEWSPAWPVARTAAIAATAADDLDPLHSFIDRGLSSDQTVGANLNYWSYWVGDLPYAWACDADMATDDQWEGGRLLNTLIAGVEHAPYRDLCAHTLWALLLSRRWLADSGPERRRAIEAAVTRALDTQEFTESARQKLSEVHFLVRRT
jgi:transcriptional regulator with XRE-family HTH domain